MKKDDFYTAIEILSKYHTSQITINQPINNFVGNLGQSEWTIHINHCVPAAIVCSKVNFPHFRFEKGTT